MAVTYGFYNSLNGDRKYNAEQMSRIFDGIIEDGVFGTVGSRFSVSPSSGMVISVAAGRAWFNHTWTYNDAPITLTVSTAPTGSLKRIDAVIIEVNANTRINTIKILTGTAAATPSRPTLTQADGIYQYAIAYITIDAGTTTITGSMIAGVVGTDTPLVTGPLQTITATALYDYWRVEFEEWFEHLQDELDEEQATHLQHQIDDLSTSMSDQFTLVEGEISGVSASIPTAYTSNPVMDGTASAGSSGNWARGDHRHPVDTSRAPTAHATTATTYGIGTGSNYGHVKLSDSYSSTSAASSGIAASPKALKDGLAAIQAINNMENPGVILFERSGSWKVPTGITKAVAILCGGGGRGGASTSSAAGGGGGSGYMAIQEIALTAGGTLTITVGAGVLCNNTSSTRGGTSSITYSGNTLASAAGGYNGASVTGNAGGNGGNGMAGGGGGSAYSSGAGGKGGTGSVYGGGGGGGRNFNSTAGVGGAGGTYGGGGGGGYNQSGSAAAAGGAKGTYGGAGGKGGYGSTSCTAGANGTAVTMKIPAVFSLLGCQVKNAIGIGGPVPSTSPQNCGGGGGGGYGGSSTVTDVSYGSKGGAGGGGFYGNSTSHATSTASGYNGGFGGGGFFASPKHYASNSVDYTDAGGGGGGMFPANYGAGGGGYGSEQVTSYSGIEYQKYLSGNDGAVVLFVPGLGGLY